MLRGIIYTHCISDEVDVTERRNLNMLYEICGPDSFTNVIIVTTMWDIVDKKIAAEREEEMKTSDDFKPFFEAGAQLKRHYNNLASAYTIMNNLLVNDPLPLLIQTELATGMSIIETAAGSALSRELDELLVCHEEERPRMEAEIMRAIMEGDEDVMEKLEDKRRKVKRCKEDKRKLRQGQNSNRTSSDGEHEETIVEYEGVQPDDECLERVGEEKQEYAWQLAIDLAVEAEREKWLIKENHWKEMRTMEVTMEVERRSRELERRFEAERTALLLKVNGLEADLRMSRKYPEVLEAEARKRQDREALQARINELEAMAKKSAEAAMVKKLKDDKALAFRIISLMQPLEGTYVIRNVQTSKYWQLNMPTPFADGIKTAHVDAKNNQMCRVNICTFASLIYN